jgi:hypothetical protein
MRVLARRTSSGSYRHDLLQTTRGRRPASAVLGIVPVQRPNTVDGPEHCSS